MAFEAVSLLSLVGALVLILISCEIFTNGIEWLGCRLGLAESATGSILAAVGTALPETMVPIIAIFFGSEAKGEEIGEGAILGAPFMLGTLAMFIGGIAVLLAYRRGKRTSDRLDLDTVHVLRDLKYFMLAYTLALIAGLWSMQSAVDLRGGNYMLAVVLLGAYVMYVRRTLGDETVIEESSCPTLHLTRVTGISTTGKSGLTLISVQVIGSLVGIIVGAKIFVDGVEDISVEIGVPAMILAFLVAPIATELPEKFNSFIWYWRSKDVLALGNITGAMVFQSSIPVSIGLLFTSWELAPINIASILIALAASAWIYYCVKIKGHVSYRTMIASGSLYVSYIILLFVFGHP
ncbi:MAG: sodium:calcium antiporter [Methanobacteriota archaeon]|nr:MAG: sodium:calcium antiporter [Euryarchaeota archaeon]